MLASAVLLWLPASLLAQDGSQRVHLEPGTDDWWAGEYGGDVRSDEMSRGCNGYVSNVPPFIMELDQESYVRIVVNGGSGHDATLMVRGPAGTICNDDANETTNNPEVVGHFPAGEHYVYVGSFTARDSGRYQINFDTIETSAFPELRSDRPISLVGVSGGQMDAAHWGESCVGAISSLPDHVVVISQGMFVEIAVNSSSDLTLTVVSGDRVHCNDDGWLSLDPNINHWFNPGLLRIYVGSHNHTVQADYRLQVRAASPN